MGSSKKHKKHKDRKHSSSNPHDESNHSFNSISNNSVISGEQGTLKLVLRVPGGSSNSPHMSPSVSVPNPDQNADAMQVVEGGGGGGGNLTMHIDTRPYSSSSGKKMKKKKSKKKHKKHHHHSHHHHSHHHRHRSSCSHHKSSSSAAIPAIEGGLPTLQLKQPALQIEPPYPVASSGGLEFNQEQPAAASNLIDAQAQQQSLISSQLSPQSISQPPMSQHSPLAQSQIIQQPQIVQQQLIAQQSPMDQCMSQLQLPSSLPSLPPALSTLDAQGNVTPITSPGSCSVQMGSEPQQMTGNYADPYCANLMGSVSSYNSMASPMTGMTNYGSSCSMASPMVSPMVSPMTSPMGGQMSGLANNSLMNTMATVSSTGYATQPMSLDMQIDSSLNQQSQLPAPILSSCQQPMVLEQGIAQSISPISQSPIAQQTMTSPIGQQPLTPQSLSQSMPQQQQIIGQPVLSQAIKQEQQPGQPQSQVSSGGQQSQQQQLVRAPIGVKPPVKTQFQSLLGYLLKQLEKRDSQEFFFWPVTDLIAPGYSKIITKPMDFSKIKQKINLNSYENLIQFRSDVKLMCDNAMTYNRPETIYYKAAKKLWYYAREKIFNRESVLDLVTLYQGVTNYELGLTCADYSDSEQINVENFDYSQLSEQMTPEQALFMREQGKAKREDEMSADEILDEVRKTAREAADRLSLQRPNGAHYTLMRQLNDGTTSLAIVGSSVNGYQEEKYVNLESIVGKLSEGAPHLPGFKESDLNNVKSIEQLAVSPFSSYLPCTDSSKSNLNEKETALLLSSYGDEVGLGYSESLLKFASDSDYVLNMVDSLLDALTNGQHSKTMEELKESRNAQEAADAMADVEMQAEAKSKETEQDASNPQDKKDETLEQKLNETGSLVANLETLQTQRLSSSTLPVKPSKEEVKIAHLLTNKLTELIGTYAKPADVSDLKSIRAALGVQLKESAL